MDEICFRAHSHIADELSVDKLSSAIWTRMLLEILRISEQCSRSFSHVKKPNGNSVPLNFAARHECRGIVMRSQHRALASSHRHPDCREHRRDYLRLLYSPERIRSARGIRLRVITWTIPLLSLSLSCSLFLACSAQLRTLLSSIFPEQITIYKYRTVSVTCANNRNRSVRIDTETRHGRGGTRLYEKIFSLREKGARRQLQLPADRHRPKSSLCAAPAAAGWQVSGTGDTSASLHVSRMFTCMRNTRTDIYTRHLSLLTWSFARAREPDKTPRKSRCCKRSGSARV